MKFFFQERPNRPFIPNLSHFPTAVSRGYKPIFLHKIVGGYLQKTCKLPMSQPLIHIHEGEMAFF